MFKAPQDAELGRDREKVPAANWNSNTGMARTHVSHVTFICWFLGFCASFKETQQEAEPGLLPPGSTGGEERTFILKDKLVEPNERPAALKGQR